MSFSIKSTAANYCGLILVIILVISPHQTFSASHCVMYGICGENDYGKATCSYNGTALPLEDEEALETLQEICPDILNENSLFCCSAGQVEQLRENFEVVATLGLERCPSCLSNFRKNFCHFACSAKQSDFLKVTGLGISDEGDLVIEKMSYYMSRYYAEGLFDSCKDVHGWIPGSTILDLMCGGWDIQCNAELWLNFMGSTPANKGYSPFEINYYLTSENSVLVDGYTYFPMNEHITLCNEKPYPDAEACTCFDCPAACPATLSR